MAIKINGDNLYRRVWNGQDVQKVILNGAVIRPYEQPHVDYHVISDFTGGGGGGTVPSMPGGWGGTGVEVTDDGVVPTGSSGTLTYTQDSGMPSLANAIKLQLVLNFDWVVPVSPSEGHFLRMSLRNGNTQYAGGILRYSSGNYMQITLGKMGYFTNVSTGNYTTSILWNMENSESPFGEMDTEGPSPFSAQSIHQGMNTTAISNIRSCNNLVITIGNGITLKSIDFFITNNYDQPTPPPTPTPTEWIPTGYHVPTYSELSGLYSLMSSDLGINMQSADVLEYLHIPECGMLSAINGRYISPSLSASGIWCSDYHNSKPASWIIFGGIGQNMGAIDSPTGCNVRPFKDTYEAPDGTWTVEYGNLSTGGIFRNQQSGLISIFYGNTGYTMADKNWGASYAWSSGDTISVNNSGYLYQWGNCYGFPLQNATTTSSTKVDTTGYGSGTLYTSSTFITSQSGDWMNPVNTTLWS